VSTFGRGRATLTWLIPCAAGNGVDAQALEAELKSLACCLLIIAGGARAAERPPPEPIWHVHVHLLSDDERVELRRVEAVPGQALCKSPCDRTVQVRSEDLFTLGGPGIASSRAFAFDPRDADLTLKVQARSSLPRTIGRALVVAGLGVSGATLSAGTLFDRCFLTPSCSFKTTETIVLSVAAVAAAAALVGALVLAYNPPTDFTSSPDATPE
jgi:hypothetical protein